MPEEHAAEDAVVLLAQGAEKRNIRDTASVAVWAFGLYGTANIGGFLSSPVGWMRNATMSCVSGTIGASYRRRLAGQ